MKFIHNPKSWLPRIKNSAVAALFLAAYTISAAAPFITSQTAYAASGDMSVGAFEGQNSDSSWSPGNNTQFAEGDYVNYRFAVSSSANSTAGVVYVKFSDCMFTNYFALYGNTAPATVTPGVQASGGGDWSQKLTIAFPTSGATTVNFTLRITNTAGDCNGSSSHVSLDTQSDKGDFGNIGSKDIPIPANSIYYSPSITLTKIVSSGTAVPSDFWFSVSPAVNGQTELHIPVGQSTVTVSDVNPGGAYVITEHGPTGYTFTGGTGTNCTTTASGVMTATVAAGRPAINASCTFTNAIQKGSITIIKDAKPNNSQDFSFTATGAGTSNFLLDDDTNATLPNSKTFPDLFAGNYTFTEAATAGWDLSSIICSNGSSVRVNGSTVSVSLAFGQDVTCTFTNLKRGTITVNKVTNPANDATPFSVTASGSGSIAGTATRNLTTAAPVTYDVAQGTYNVSELVPSGWVQDGNTCTNLVINATNLSVNCTITNMKQAKLKIVKQAQPNDAQDFAFTATGTGLSSFSLDDDGDATLSNFKQFEGLAPGTYSVTETSTPGWAFMTVSCDVAYAVNGSMVSVQLAAGQEATCTYTNTKLGSLSGIKYEVNADNSIVSPSSGWLITLFSNGVSTGLTATTNGSGAYSFSDLLAGNYSVTESLKSGWTQIYNPISAASLAAGQNVIDQNFGNFKNGSISGYKFNDHNGNGAEDSGDEHMSGWTMTLYKVTANRNVPTGITQITNSDGNYSFTNLEPGTYWVCETPQTGWVQTFPVGNTCNEVVIDQSGETNTAVKFGNQGRGTITVRKNVDTNGDGIVDASNVSSWTWDLGASNFATGTTQNVPAGNYTINEDQQDGYHFTSVVCNEEKYSQAESVIVNVAAGEDVVCTFTNTRDTGTIEIVKYLSPTSDEGVFDLQVDGSTVLEDATDNDSTGQVRVVTGTHSVSEQEGDDSVNLDNYDSSYYCYDQADTYDPWSASGYGTEVSEISVSYGQHIRCDFYNQRHAELIIVKDAQPNDAQDFNFTLIPVQMDEKSQINQPAINFDQIDSTTHFQLDDDDDATLPDNAKFELSSGWYAVSEDQTQGWDLTGIQCGDDSDESWFVDEETGDLYVNLSSGDAMKCTFTNTKRATVTVVKDAQPDFAQSFIFSTNLEGEAPSTFSLSDDGTNAALASKVFSDITPGTYSVSESEVSGWTLNDISCTGAEMTRDGAKLTIDVQAGANVRCTFVNKKDPGHVLGAITPQVLEDTGGSIGFPLFMSSGIFGLSILTVLQHEKRSRRRTIIFSRISAIFSEPFVVPGC